MSVKAFPPIDQQSGIALPLRTVYHPQLVQCHTTHTPSFPPAPPSTMARPCHGRQQQQQHMRTSTLRSVTLAVVIVALVVVLGTTLVCAEAAERGRTRGGARRARQRRERPAAAAAGGPGAPLSELPAQLATRTYTRTPATLKAFRTWFARAGGWTHKNVKFQLSNQYGVRLIARRDIPEADVSQEKPQQGVAPRALCFSLFALSFAFLSFARSLSECLRSCCCLLPF